MILVAKHSLLVGLILLSGVSLSACNRQSGTDAPESDPFATSSIAKEDQFGEGFGKAFRADPNSEPAKVSKRDVIPVSHTTEPVEIN